MAKKITKTQISAEIKDYKAIQDALERQADWYRQIGDSETARAKAVEQNTERQRIINDLLENQNKLSKTQNEYLETLKKEQTDAIANEKETNKILEAQADKRRRINTVVGEANRQLKEGWKFLMESDKTIKSTILNLGMSGVKAETLRLSFEQSAGFVARLGGNLEDIQKIMEGYADETGRARTLSAQMVQDITAIGKGTGLGVAEATKLGAQFELMGFDAKSTMDYVQGVVDTSERMGVNTTKVLKNVSDNFKKLNTYTFQQGVKGMAQMAMYAEKFKVDINDALNAATVAKSLEGAIDLAAQLQIMGGEFAKTDPFQMLFLARNDPAKFTEKIADMTKGVVTFRKMSDGTFEKFISPADRDRLRAVAKSLGMEESALTQIAERTAEIGRMRREMVATGLSSKDKTLIEGMAIFNKETGKFTVQIGNASKDISKITSADAQILTKQKVSLEERAKSAQTFEDAFKATIAELKTALLPILQSINKILVAIRPTVVSITKFFTEGPSAWIKVAGLFMGVGVMWKGILQPFMQKIGGATVGKLASKIRGGGIVRAAEEVGGEGKGLAGAARPGAGMGMLKGGAGIGAAALGIGAGIGLAATGIAKLADAMSKLDKTQLAALPKVMLALGAALAIVMIPLVLLGPTLDVAAPGLAAFGLAALGVGAGIGIAAMGIGKMAEGLATLVTAGKGAGSSMLELAGGIGAISLAMLGMTGGIVGVLTFSLLMNKIAKHAPDLERVGEAFKQINTVLSGNKEDYIAIQNVIESISKLNTKGGSTFSDLAALLKNPLKVEFSDKEVALVTNVNLNVDSSKFHEAAHTAQVVAVNTKYMKEGKLTK